MKFLKRSLVAGVAIFCVSIIAGIAFMFQSVKAVEPMVDNIAEHLKDYNSKPSIIYSADHVKLYELYPIYSEPVNVSSLPKHVIRAVLAAEDKRFYEHPGVDIWGMLRVGRNVFTKSDRTGGGSTITMQLAKKLFSASEKSVQRKVQDISIAIQLEKRYTKDQILELYLNQIYYGEQAYGLNAAAEIYFGKKAEDLDLAEAAMIARCIRTPSLQNPVKNYQLANTNKIFVLSTMRDEGWITEQEFEKAKDEKPKVKGIANQKLSRTSGAYYFVAAVKRDLEKMGINISEGGYSITTTLDSELQRNSEAAVDREIRYDGGSGPNVGAFICMDSQGRILADVGGRNYAKNQLSYTTQSKLQPGSSFKSFIYSEALKNNIIGEGSEISNEQYKWGSGKSTYRPKNHGSYGGTVSLEEAFAKSINMPAVWTFAALGFRSGVDHITEDFGFKSEIKAFPSTALGASEVKMFEMLEAYSVFMLDGKRVRPYRIKEITGPDGELVYQGKMDYVTTRIGPEVCQVMDRLMERVVTSGTGYNARGCPGARGKTGTTNDGKSGWFCGYAKGIVGIAWAGREEYNKKRNKWYLQPLSEYGNDVAAPFWASAMSLATRKYGSDVRPDFNVKPEDEEPRRRRRQKEEDTTNADNIPVQVDNQTAPESDGENPAMAPTTDGQDPQKNGDGTADPLKDPASDTGVKHETTATEPKKPRDDKVKKPEKPVESDMVEAEVCADSGLLSTRYCPETINKRMSKGKRPKRRCTVHKAPDESGGG
jgi:penicillin-binding protein 1A